MTGDYSRTVRGVAELARLRQDLRRWLAQLGCHDRATADIILAVTELATNAVEASPDGNAEVRARAEPPDVRVAVLNEGDDFRPESPRPARDTLSDRGRGIDLVLAVTDSLDFDHLHGCTQATITKRCA